VKNKVEVLSTRKGIEIKVVVRPRSSQSKIVGIHDGGLKIKLTKPPKDGQANEECRSLIAKALGTLKSKVTIVQGKTSRQKVIRIEGMLEKDIDERLLKGIIE